MDGQLQVRLIDAWSKRPRDMRYPPASELELAAFEARFGKTPPVFR